MGQFSPDLAITGSAQTGLTSPTFTWVADLPPDASSKQWAVSALGGTQTNVRTHSQGDPFTVTIRRGRYSARPNANPVTGAYGVVPLNKIELLARKGVKIDSSGTIRTGQARLTVELPAGAEQYDTENIRAMLSNLLGVLAEESSDFGDTCVTGIIA